MKNRILSIILALAMLLSVAPTASFALDSNVWDGTIATSFASGSGTAADPFLIENGSQLSFIRNKLGYQNRNLVFKLTANIDLGGLDWTPIGSDATQDNFQGTLLGNGHTIKNLSVSGSQKYAGLFAYTVSSTISELTIQNASIATSGYYAGALAAKSIGDNFTKVNVVDSSVKSARYTGGIVGAVEGSSTGITITSCGLTGESTVENTVALNACGVGGILGSFLASSGSITINGCFNNSTANPAVKTYASNAGGIVGYMKNTNNKIFNCYNTSAVKASSKVASQNTGVGGILGYSSSGSKVYNSYNTGDVTAASTYDKNAFCYGGGVAGYCPGLEVNSCFNLGKVTGPSSSKPYPVGGYIGGVSDSNWYLKGTATNKQSASDATELATQEAVYEKMNSVLVNNAPEFWQENSNGCPILLGVAEIKPEHEHQFGAWEKNDSQTHIRHCTDGDCDAFETEAHNWNDGEVTTEPTCGADGVKTYICTVCGEIRTEAIAATGNHVDVDGNGKCDVCDKDTDVHNHTDANGDGICDGENCGAIMAHPGKDHTWGAWEKNDSQTHIRHCTIGDCKAFETEAHNWNGGEVTTEPTCGADGVKTYTCTVCGETRTEAIAATGNHVDADGNGKCDVCDKDTDAHNHTDANGDGICDGENCGAIMAHPGEDHTWGAWEKNDSQTHIRHCTIGDCKAFETEAHNWNDGEVTTEPTCGADGVKTYICTVCGETRTEAIVATGNHVDADGNGKCDVCDKDTDVHNHTDANGDGVCDGENCGAIMAHPGKDHTWGAWEKNDSQTHIRHCTIGDCKAFETEVHNWNDGEVTTEPTCGAAGVKTYTCTVCGETRTESIAATGNHVDADGNGKCDVCDKDTDSHNHTDANGDGKCDVCDKDTDVHKHMDSNADHKCDLCGTTISDCKDDNHDHKCDICGKTVSDCADKDNDGKCDVCGKDIHESTKCGCICHKANQNHFYRVIYKIVRVFWRLFRINTCKCGAAH